MNLAANELESHYSSDDDVFWGPPTLKEFQKRVVAFPKKIHKRRSDPGYLLAIPKKMNSSNISDHSNCSNRDRNTEKNISDNNKIDNSEYFTANEDNSQSSSESNKVDVFLEKIKEVIANKDLLDLSNTDKLSQHSKNNVGDPSQIKDCAFEIPKIVINRELEESNTSDLTKIDNVHLTLVENTIFVSSDDDSFVSNAITKAENLDDSVEEVVTIESSEDENEIVIKAENIFTAVANKSFRSLYNQDVTKNYFASISNVSSTNNNSCPSIKEMESFEKDSLNLCQSHEFTDLYTQQHQFSNQLDSQEIFEKTEDISLKSNESTRTDNIDNNVHLQQTSAQTAESNEDNLKSQFEELNFLSNENLSFAQQSLENPIASNVGSENDIQMLVNNNEDFQCPTNRESEDSYRFNDTLEEMEMAMKAYEEGKLPKNNFPPSTHIQNECFNLKNLNKGNTKIKEKSASKPTQIPQYQNKNYSCLKSPLADNIVQGQGSSSTIKLQPSSSKKTNLETRKLGRPDKFEYVESPISRYIKTPTPTHDKFKTPTRKPITATVTPSCWKNVVAPLRIYIKNSPAVSLRNAAVHNRSFIDMPNRIPNSVSESIQSNKENELPFVIYKPAKETIVTVDSKINLPSNIQKLVPFEPKVIICEKRIKTVEHNQSVIRQKLLEQDFSGVENDSTFGSVTDVSYHINKQNFIE